MTEYVSVVDISRYQGTYNFKLGVEHGVQGWILRATHARTIDLRLNEYVQGLRAAGVPDSQVGFYTFVNPSRCDATTAARVFVDAVREARGDTDTFLMLDVENYTDKSNLGSLPILKGEDFADYLQELADAIHEYAPTARVVIYSNAAYWNTWVGRVHVLGGYDIIVPRYIHYSEYAPKPPKDPKGWAGWCMSQPKRPQVPYGFGGWRGWQFSAGFNGAGAFYGAQSKDLDLNIVDPVAWARWTAPTPEYVNPAVVFLEDDMAQLAPELVRFRGYKNVFLFADNTFTHLTEESTARYRAAGIPDVVLDAHPQGLKSALSKAGLQWADLVVEGA